MDGAEELPRDVLRVWDKAAKHERRAILLQLRERCAAAEVDDPGACLPCDGSLFLLRVVSWLRWSFKHEYELALQLRTILAFLRAPSELYVEEFVHAGGNAAVGSVVSLATLHRDDDRHAALEVLCQLAQRGEEHVERIAHPDSLSPLLDFIAHAVHDCTVSQALDLLRRLAHADPERQLRVANSLHVLMARRSNPLVQAMACQAGCSVLAGVATIAHRQVVSMALVGPTLRALGSTSVLVHRAASELLLDIVRGRAASEDELSGPEPEPDPEPCEEEDEDDEPPPPRPPPNDNHDNHYNHDRKRRASVQGCAQQTRAVIAGLINTLRQQRRRSSVGAQIQAQAVRQAQFVHGNDSVTPQVSSVRLLGAIAQMGVTRLSAVAALGGVVAVLTVLMNVHSHESQKAATLALGAVARGAVEHQLSVQGDLLALFGTQLFSRLCDVRDTRTANDFVAAIGRNERRMDTLKTKLYELGWGLGGDESSVPGRPTKATVRSLWQGLKLAVHSGTIREFGMQEGAAADLARAHEASALQEAAGTGGVDSAAAVEGYAKLTAAYLARAGFPPPARERRSTQLELSKAHRVNVPERLWEALGAQTSAADGDFRRMDGGMHIMPQVATSEAMLARVRTPSPLSFASESKQVEVVQPFPARAPFYGPGAAPAGRGRRPVPPARARAAAAAAGGPRGRRMSALALTAAEDRSSGLFSTDVSDDEGGSDLDGDGDVQDVLDEADQRAIAEAGDDLDADVAVLVSRLQRLESHRDRGRRLSDL